MCLAAVHKSNKDAFAIADKYVPDYKRAFRIMRAGLASQISKVSPAAGGWRKFPLYDPTRPRAIPGYARAVDAFERVFIAIVEESGEAALAEAGIDRMQFTVKARKRPSVAVPQNTYSLDWIRTKSASRVVEITKQQRESVKAVLSNGLKENLPRRDISETLKQTVGLHEAYAIAVENRRITLLAAGELSESEIDKHCDRYAEKLLDARVESIARTETKDALERGQLDAWRVADDEGYMPEGTEKEWIVLDHSPRLSDICAELDGQRVGLHEKFYSAVLDVEIDHPPAHPNCRSVTRLVFKE